MKYKLLQSAIILSTSFARGHLRKTYQLQHAFSSTSHAVDLYKFQLKLKCLLESYVNVKSKWCLRFYQNCCVFY